MGTDADIQSQITALEDEQRELRAFIEGAEQVSPEVHERLAALQQQIDQHWDLLRQRRAKEEFGADPDQAQERSVGEVEGYQA